MTIDDRQQPDAPASTTTEQARGAIGALVHRLTTDAVRLPVEGELAPFDAATAWLNTEPLTRDALRGHPVAVDFWTYTCINWRRTLPFVRAWADRYRADGLVVIGVHTPEFPFEQDVANVRRAVADIGVDYPVAVDSRYGVWNAFGNQYWPALYLADGDGAIRHHSFGEGEYAESEMAIQQLLAESGTPGYPAALTMVEGRGFEAAADWANLRTPESYLGYERGESLATDGWLPDQPHRYAAPDRLRLNEWALAGDWTITSRAAVLDGPEGRVAFQFHGRDLHLVMGRGDQPDSVPFRVSIDGQGPGPAHGVDVDSEGHGTLDEPRLYQLIRQSKPIVDRRFEIEFLRPGAAAFAFTLG